MLAYETAIVEALHGLGGRAIYHNCGRASVLLPVLREIGMDVYESFTPPPFGDTGLDDALRVMEGITLMGGIDQIDFLRKATPDAVTGKPPRCSGSPRRAVASSLAQATTSTRTRRSRTCGLCARGRRGADPA